MIGDLQPNPEKNFFFLDTDGIRVPPRTKTEMALRRRLVGKSSAEPEVIWQVGKISQPARAPEHEAEEKREEKCQFQIHARRGVKVEQVRVQRLFLKWGQLREL